MRISYVVISCALFLITATAQRPVVIPVSAHEQIRGDLYGSGEDGIVLAHGGRFNKESWAPQARVLADAGFTVLAINFRGDRLNPDGTPSAEGSDADNAIDVVAAVHFLRANGSKTVFAIGGSLGGDAVGNANAQLKPGEIERVVFLGSEGGDHPEQLTGRKLFIVGRTDTSGSGLRLPGIQDHFARAPEPKKLVIVDDSAHAQFLFTSVQGQQVMHEILAFVSAK